MYAHNEDKLANAAKDLAASFASIAVSLKTAASAYADSVSKQPNLNDQPFVINVNMGADASDVNVEMVLRDVREAIKNSKRPQDRR